MPHQLSCFVLISQRPSFWLRDGITAGAIVSGQRDPTNYKVTLSHQPSIYSSPEGSPILVL
jgi:hypothetical protein